MDEVIYTDDLENDLLSHRERINSRIREIRAKKFYKSQELDKAKALRDNLNRRINILRDKGMTINKDDYADISQLDQECRTYLA